MKRINELREQRSTLAKEVRNLLEQNPGAKWNKAEHQPIYDAKMADIERCDEEIARLQAAVELGAEQVAADAVQQVAKDAGKKDPNSPAAVFDAFLRGGIRNLTPEQVPVFRNTMSTTTGSEGGYTVPTTIAAKLIETLKAFGGMRQAAEVFATEAGNDMSWPTSDGTAEVGELVAQNVAAATADPTFGTVGLSVYKFSSKTITVPIELLQDSVIDIEAFVRQRAATRLGRIMNTFFTTGTGSSQPRGVVTGASSGKVGTTGQTLTVIYDDLVDLEHSVDPAYRGAGCKFMLNDASLKVIRKIKDGQSRPLFIPAYDGGFGAAPASLLGYPIVINQDVAVMAANAKSILFGDFSAYKIRDVLQVSLFRFDDSAFMTKGQVGFLAWARAGGNLTDSAAVKYYANSAT
jgi:HK97 family phage major capsid protein